MKSLYIIVYIGFSIILLGTLRGVNNKLIDNPFIVSLTVAGVFFALNRVS